ncbi:cupin domain-containing protein [Actinomadura terrae]|uniref:cupin domain-containing protein n=1 Tax=Actinomadura terrae TaxID=604353 RepID=UPI001FA8130B|nr:cupin domain-containing protein [Actinomadura terrae]
MTLADLLRPRAVADFLDTEWTREPCVFPGAAKGAALLDLDGFEAMLGGLHYAHEGLLHLAHGDRRRLPATFMDADGMLDLRQVRKAFKGGETLYLTKAHRLSPVLADLCRGVELDLADHGVVLRKPAGAHVFATPPSAQGFAPHRDEHGSLVVQTEGRKAWMVEERPGPPRPGAISPQEWAKIRFREFALEPGDVLYVPEYCGHAARTEEAHSLHVTLRLFPLRWRDVLDEVVGALPALNAFVPAARTHDPAALATGLAELLRSPDVGAALPGLLAGLAARRTERRAVLPDGGLGGPDGIDENTWLVRARGADCHVTSGDDAATIHFPGGAVRGPIGVLAAFEHIAKARVLRAADLPGALDPDASLGVVRKLVADGLLRRARPGETAETGEFGEFAR